jgi:hypothetical protein
MYDEGLIGGPCVEIAPHAAEPDEGWGLWRALREPLAESRGSRSKWEPITVRRVLDDEAPPLYSSRLEVSFDSRVSKRRLKLALDELWPELEKEGHVRRTRPMEERAAELVRFVCLECDVGATWRERLIGWNDRHSEWSYGEDPRNFSKDFRRAEQQLTGRRYGLAWFYSQRLRDASRGLELLPREELWRRRRSGDKTVEAWMQTFHDPIADVLVEQAQRLGMRSLGILAQRVQLGQVTRHDLDELDAPADLFDRLNSVDLAELGRADERVLVSRAAGQDADMAAIRSLGPLLDEIPNAKLIEVLSRHEDEIFLPRTESQSGGQNEGTDQG